VVGFQADVEKFRRTNETGTKLFKMEEIVTPTYRPHRRPLRVCRTRLHFADRL
jgi:hypothetical protein